LKNVRRRHAPEGRGGIHYAVRDYVTEVNDISLKSNHLRAPERSAGRPGAMSAATTPRRKSSGQDRALAEAVGEGCGAISGRRGESVARAA
jgi:hypothetical protein